MTALSSPSSWDMLLSCQCHRPPLGNLYPVSDSHENPLASGKEHLQVPVSEFPAGSAEASLSLFKPFFCRCRSLKHTMINFSQVNVYLRVCFLRNPTCSIFPIGFTLFCRTFLSFSLTQLTYHIYFKFCKLNPGQWSHPEEDDEAGFLRVLKHLKKAPWKHGNLS